MCNSQLFFCGLRFKKKQSSLEVVSNFEDGSHVEWSLSQQYATISNGTMR